MLSNRWEILPENEASQKKTDLGDSEKETVPLGSQLEFLDPAVPEAHAPQDFSLTSTKIYPWLCKLVFVSTVLIKSNVVPDIGKRTTQCLLIPSCSSPSRGENPPVSREVSHYTWPSHPRLHGGSCEH